MSLRFANPASRPQDDTPISYLPSLHRISDVTGGGERDRTDDPLLAKQVLSQLSYTPGLSAAKTAWFETGAFATAKA